MTAILVGRAPQGNFIVTDAMSSDPSHEIKSYKDCQLVNKISHLESAGSYCSLAGDATLETGIVNLNWWYASKNITIDFTKEEVMQNAMDSAETFIKINANIGGGYPKKGITKIYCIDRERVFEYVIFFVNKKYKIDTLRFFSENEVILNYSGYKSKITNFNHPNNQIFKKATELLVSEHKANKQNKKDYTLEYDFNDRFCGVVFSKIKKEKEKLYTPFKSLSEGIASELLSPKDFWALIEDKKFLKSSKC